MNEGGGEDPVGIERWSRALSWHAALREGDEKELTNSVGREWQDWYAHAENRRAFDSVSRFLADRDLYRKRRQRGKEELGDDTYDLSVPIAEWRRARAVQETQKQHLSGETRRWLSGRIGVAAAAALIVLWPRAFEFGEVTGDVVYQTDVGGLKDVHLPDGSSIILGGRTELTVAYSAQYRSVSLIEGQAWFKVSHAPHRPFVVTAGDGTIKDMGTAFLVTRESDRVVVTVTEGAVEVSARQPLGSPIEIGHRTVIRPAPAPIRISRGEQLAFSDTGTLGPIKQTDTHAATAWTSGSLTFDNQPLRYVVETVNRYSSRRIVVSASVGAFRFSGIVHNDEIGDWLQSLEAIFPVTVEERGGNTRIQMRYTTTAASELLNKKSKRNESISITNHND